jgi:glycosyltransferase involved in cell wall biosynthesis
MHLFPHRRLFRSGGLDREAQLFRASKADVLMPLDGDPAALLRTAACVLNQAEPVFGLLVLYGTVRDERGLLDRLQNRVQPGRPRVVFVEIDPHHNQVDEFRQAAMTCAGDVVLLSGGCEPQSGWLAELAAVAHAEERTACVSPLVNDSQTCSASLASLAYSGTKPFDEIVRLACVHLPRWTVTPVVSPACVYLRRTAIEAVGLFEPAFVSRDVALNDWMLKAQSLGFDAKRANHAFVPCRGGARHYDTTQAIKVLLPDALIERHPHFAPQIAQFERSLDAHLVSHAVRVEAGAKVSVALDIRDMPPEQVGTRTYAVNLAKALRALPEIELTLLVRNPDQARGVDGRVVTVEQWDDDVALIHKPAQAINASELELLFQSSAHVVITYQDLIAYRIPLSFKSASRHAEYCATSRLALTAVQRVIAYSQCAQAEIASEFGLPRDEISVVALGVEPSLFRERLPLDRVIRTALRLPRCYFFSVASDYPHKNLPNLLDAYSQFRSRWRGGEPPALVLAGYASGARTGLYPRLESEAVARGLIFLGPVSQQALKILYQDALGLVFCSLYEGFGLPPLEAMAAGTPVIAMPFSAVPEVGSECVLYPDGLSSFALAIAMEKIARDEALRNELREKGRIRVDELRWEETARHTLEVYRSTILAPSQRSLRMRRLLRDAIVHWSGNHSLRPGASTWESGSASMAQSIGIRQAYRALDVAVRARFTREIRRFRRITARRSA